MAVSVDSLLEAALETRKEREDEERERRYKLMPDTEIQDHLENTSENDSNDLDPPPV